MSLLSSVCQNANRSVCVPSWLAVTSKRPLGVYSLYSVNSIPLSPPLCLPLLLSVSLSLSLPYLSSSLSPSPPLCLPLLVSVSLSSSLSPSPCLCPIFPPYLLSTLTFLSLYLTHSFHSPSSPSSDLVDPFPLPNPPLPGVCLARKC